MPNIRVPALSLTFTSLRQPNYRKYAAGSLVSYTGTWMQRIAQDWLVLELTSGSGTALGVTTGLQFLPVLLFSPYAGVIADRFPKRRLLQLTQLAMGMVALVLAIAAVVGGLEVWHVYTLAFLLGVGSAFDAPARQSFVSELVDRDELTNAVGLNAASFNLARVAGPALAGLLIAALGGGPAATGWVILVNAASYGAVIIQLERMDTALMHSPTPPARTPRMLREGIRYVRSQPKMLMVLVVVFFTGTFGMEFAITSALMVTQVYHEGAGKYGLLGTLVAIGSLTGALMTARRKRIRVRLLIGAALAFGAVQMAAGLMPTYLSFAAVCPVMGLCLLTLLSSANATMQLESDAVFRGRVMALHMTVAMGGVPLGSPLIGWIGETFGARWSLIFGGLMVMVGAGLASTLLLRSNVQRAAAPRHRLEDRVEDVAAASPAARR